MNSRFSDLPVSSLQAAEWNLFHHCVRCELAYQNNTLHCSEMGELCSNQYYFETRLGLPGECLPCSILCDDAEQRNNIRDCLFHCPDFFQSDEKTPQQDEHKDSLQIVLPSLTVLIILSVIIGTFLYRRRRRYRLPHSVYETRRHPITVEDQYDAERILQSLEIDQVDTDRKSSCNADVTLPVTLTTGIESIGTNCSPERQQLAMIDRKSSCNADDIQPVSITTDLESTDCSPERQQLAMIDRKSSCNADDIQPVTITTDLESTGTDCSSERQQFAMSELVYIESRYIQPRSESSMSDGEWV